MILLKDVHLEEGLRVEVCVPGIESESLEALFRQRLVEAGLMEGVERPPIFSQLCSAMDAIEDFDRLWKYVSETGPIFEIGPVWVFSSLAYTKVARFQRARAERA